MTKFRPGDVAVDDYGFYVRIIKCLPAEAEGMLLVEPMKGHPQDWRELMFYSEQRLVTVVARKAVPKKRI